MKYILLLLSLTFLVCCKENDTSKKSGTLLEKAALFVPAKIKLTKIDSLKTDREVEDYIHVVDTNLREIRLVKYKDIQSRYKTVSDSIVKTWAINYGIDNSFYKEDFDNNGYTDLLIIGDNHYCGKDTLTCDFSSFVLMNFGKDSLVLKNIVREWNSIVVPQIKNDSTGRYLLVHSVDSFLKKKNEPIHKVNRLVYKFDNFIEYNPAKAGSKVEKIQFGASPCFGTCPSFEIVVNNDSSALFIAKSNNFTQSRMMQPKEEGVFKARLNTVAFNKVMDLVNYLDIKNLNKEYAVPWTDSPSATIKVTYSDGSVKTIEDYGLSGTNGLKVLYGLFFDLRFNQKWKPAKEPKGVRLSTY